ncbi:MAG: hypothetical protein K5745_03820 [Saccharofermentans sp.]|nr:hypothetical protein [Saccharofermentans sp.]
MPIFADTKQKNIANFQKSIQEKKNTIRRNYDEIGHLYYGQYKDINIDCTKDINAKCDAITRLNEEIEELEIKILRERGLKRCPVCRTENNLAYAFCFKCGARFDDEDSVPAPEAAPKAEAPKAEEPEVEAEAEDTEEDKSED